MTKAGKKHAAPAARANRANSEQKLGTHRYGRAGKHEFREWGDKHGGQIAMTLPNLYTSQQTFPFNCSSVLFDWNFCSINIEIN